MSVPEILADELLVRVAYSGICATDYEILGGEMSLIRDGKIKYPVRFWHEWSGVVERVGAEVTKFAPGDRFVSDPGIACGRCPACLRGDYDSCRDVHSLGTASKCSTRRDRPTLRLR